MHSAAHLSTPLKVFLVMRGSRFDTLQITA